MKKRKSFDIDGHAHELTFSVYRRRKLFDDPECIRLFIEAIDRAREIHGFELWAFVVMPEHAHVLYFPEKGTTVAQVLRAIKQPASSRILNYLRAHHPARHEAMHVTNRRGQRERRFWQTGGGYDRNVYDEDTAQTMINYIHHNPVRRGLVENAADWPHSSCNAYHGGTAAIPIDRFGSSW